jgi:hypothetical protein
MRHRSFRLSLMGMAGLLIALSLSIPASAAISNGPKFTNSVAAEEQRIVQFHQAEQAFQEQLKVGRERYNQKQIKRAAVIAAMSSELQSRQQTVVIEPVAVPEGSTDEPVSWFQPLQFVAVLALGFISFGFYRNHQRAKEAISQQGRPIAKPAPKAVAKAKAEKPPIVAKAKADGIFFCKTLGANGRGLVTQEGFVVLKGSIGRKQIMPSTIGKSNEPFRVKLLDAGVMREKGDTVIFEKDHLFRSPSMAATALMGETANGWLEWKTEEGLTLDSVQRHESR